MVPRISGRMLWTVVVVAILGMAYRIWIAVPAVELRGDGANRYHPIARNLLEGNGFSSDQTAPFQPNDREVPGYPVFLAAVYAFTGGSVKAVVIVQLLLELGFLLLIARIATLLELPRAVRYLAISIAWLSPFLPTYSGLILSEVLATFALTYVCYLLVRVNRDSAAQQFRSWFFVGLVSGLCMLIRAELLITAGLVAVPVIVTRHGMQRRTKVGMIGVFALGSAVALAPWSLRHYLVFGSVQIPGQKQFAFIDNGYMKWCGTWWDDPQWIDPYGYQVLDPAGPAHFPATHVPDPEERRRAEHALALAKRNGTLAGAPAEEFGRLAIAANARKSIVARARLPVRRTVAAWVRLPALARYPQPFLLPFKSAVYILWLVVLVSALVATMYVFVLRQYRLIMLPALLGARTLLPLTSAFGIYPGYLLEALPAVFLLASLGLWIVFRQIGSLTRSFSGEARPTCCTATSS